MAEGEIAFRESGRIRFTAANVVASDDTSVLHLTASAVQKSSTGLTGLKPRRQQEALEGIHVLLTGVCDRIQSLEMED